MRCRWRTHLRVAYPRIVVVTDKPFWCLPGKPGRQATQGALIAAHHGGSPQSAARERQRKAAGCGLPGTPRTPPGAKPLLGGERRADSRQAFALREWCIGQALVLTC